MAKPKTSMTLIALDTEGTWNRPLLENAAALSGAGCVYASSDTGEPAAGVVPLDQAISGQHHVIACEAVRVSVGLYDFPVPRGKIAVIVGNEERGIPRSVLKKADSVVSIPMSGTGMSSVNVAVSAAISLYGFSKDFGRRKMAHSDMRQRDVDMLIHAPADPHELGSLLRSAWAFGWRRVFVSDPHRVWFTRDEQTMLASRAAARRHKNPLAVLPVDDLDWSGYDAALGFGGDRTGTPLSRLNLPQARRVLLILGASAHGTLKPNPVSTVDAYVDYAHTGISARCRHSGSIVLSVISQMLGK